MNPWKASKTGDELPSVLFFSPTTIVASLIQFIRTAPHSLRLSFSLLSSLVSLGVPTLHIVPGGTSTFRRRDDDDSLNFKVQIYPTELCFLLTNATYSSEAACRMDFDTEARFKLNWWAQSRHHYEARQSGPLDRSERMEAKRNVQWRHKSSFQIVN